MAMLKNHYELLGLELNATPDEIKKAYIDRTLATSDPLMCEYIKTAYYVLKNPIRRQKYDLTIGIHKYRNVSRSQKVGKALLRGLLTFLDYVFTFYWCVLIAIILLVAGYYIYKYYDTGIMEFSFIPFVQVHKEEIIILGGFALIDLLGHYYIRRANRFLKNYKWEYIVKEDNQNG